MKEWYEIYNHIQSELEVTFSDEEREEKRLWSHTIIGNGLFHQGIIDNIERGLQKAWLKKKIEELQEAYNKLDGKSNDE